MITNSGIVVDPGMDSAPSETDIAISMCRVTRYAGSIWCPLSVHSILTVEMAFQKTGNYRTYAYGLLHDCHETITGEIVRAWKPPEMKTRESELDGRILPTFGLRREELYDLSADIRYADEKALCLEASIRRLPGWRSYYEKKNHHPPIEPNAWETSFANRLFDSHWMDPASILTGSRSVALLCAALVSVRFGRFEETRNALSGPFIDRMSGEEKAT